MHARNRRSPPSRWSALVGICIAAALVWLAFADLGVALPTIATQLDVSLTDMQWANNALSIACGTLLLATGRFADLYGRRRLLLLGLVVFGCASLVTAFLSGLAGLIVGRAVMGIGGALILPATLALIPVLFSRAEQPTAFAAWAAATWAGQALGPAFGGTLTTLLGWRSLFWISAPAALVAYLLTSRNTPESREVSSGRVDLVGVVTSAGAALCLLFALTEGQRVGFRNPVIIGLFVAALLLAALFVIVELKITNPLVDLRLFRARSFDGALTVNLTMNITFAGTLFVLALYLQDVRGYSAFVAGLLLVPAAVTILVFNTVGARITARHDARTPAVGGLLLISLGFFVVSPVTPTSSFLLVILGLLIVGVGLGLLSVPMSDTLVGGPPTELAGVASGVFKTSSMLGGALGVVLLTAVTASYGRARAGSTSAAAGLSEEESSQVVNALTNSQTARSVLDRLPTDQRAVVTGAYDQAFADGVSAALVLSGVIALVGAALSWWIWPRHRQG
ncbi:MFS transporter [Micromonospora sp. WMMA1363]|uniref:MFS transporter n=1 Tax=Micromonospora sp. WMMA1363 TaxID=3053985 RepID=UPI00259C79A4|nr:MFS transporter [Micromonospora sp. WMMA1363]MDM4719565.1 MFS transporter [Micromonospora sp. WMMA1363]